MSPTGIVEQRQVVPRSTQVYNGSMLLAQENASLDDRHLTPMCLGTKMGGVGNVWLEPLQAAEQCMFLWLLENRQQERLTNQEVLEQTDVERLSNDIR